MTMEDRLAMLDEGIDKAKMILDGYTPNILFTPEEYIKFYDCVYFLCFQHGPHDHSRHLYERYGKALRESIFSKVLPSLFGKNGTLLLVELLNMWTNYKVMAKCLGGFFLYLDQHFVTSNHLLSLADVSVSCFRDFVCKDLYPSFVDAAISVIRQDRSKTLIDRNLLQNVSAFFVEMEEEGKISYYDGFENAVLTDAAAYYSKLASEALSLYVSTDYILKAQLSLNEEKVRASEFLNKNSIEKLLQVVHWLMIGQTAAKLKEKQRAEDLDSKVVQELLSRCADLSLGDGSSCML